MKKRFHDPLRAATQHPRIIPATHRVVSPWHAPRPVRSHRPDRRGWDGRGVSGDGHQPGAAGSHQGTPAAVAADAERLARFDREAKTLAALNHPNIAAIYGLEKSAGTTALVMELVEGPTLADRIGKGPIPIDEALPIAKQIAEALEAAHEQGIIHRDLKPANIKVRPDRTVKVLDFGLAKATEPAGWSAVNTWQAPTITTPAMTEVGMILGTAVYMSPEQAAGLPVDCRADIWSYGVVLCEMLSGQRLFGGETVVHTLADVLRSSIDFDGLRPPPRQSNTCSAGAWIVTRRHDCATSARHGWLLRRYLAGPEERD